VFNQLWTTGGVNARIQGEIIAFEKQVIRSLSFIGEGFINKARLKNEFMDRTGNLRSSIGYTIFKDGKNIFENIERSASGDEKGRGVSAAKSFESQINVKDGFVLVVFAGMEYAIYVEASGRDVLTGSAPSSSEVKSLLKDLI